MAFYGSPWLNLNNSAAGLGVTISDVLLRKKLMEWEMARRAEEFALERERAGAQIPLMRAQTAQTQAQTEAARGGEAREAGTFARAQDIGRAVTLARILGGQGPTQPPSVMLPAMQQAGTLAQSAGVLESPSGMSPQLLASLMQAIGQGGTAGIATSTPQTAAHMMMPQNVGPNDTAISPLTWETIARGVPTTRATQPVIRGFSPGQEIYSFDQTGAPTRLGSVPQRPEVERWQNLINSIIAAGSRTLPEDKTPEQLLAEKLAMQKAIEQLGKLGQKPGNQVITDGQGRRWRYKGTLADPTQDTNENNWEQLD